MSPIRSIFRSISSEVADFMVGEPEWFGWKCIFCDEYAQDGVHLEMQYFAYENCLYIDTDYTAWVRCGTCQKSCHLHCISPHLNAQNFKQSDFHHQCNN